MNGSKDLEPDRVEVSSPKYSLKSHLKGAGKLGERPGEERDVSPETRTAMTRQ